jgi:hypothetical protein
MNRDQTCLGYAVASTFSLSEHIGKTCFDYVEHRKSLKEIV